MWQPIMEYFITGTFDDNVVVQIDAETIVIDQSQRLLNVRGRALNKGSVPFKFNEDDKSELLLEIRRIEQAVNGHWIDPPSYPVTIKKTSSNPQPQILLLLQALTGPRNSLLSYRRVPIGFRRTYIEELAKI